MESNRQDGQTPRGLWLNYDGEIVRDLNMDSNMDVDTQMPGVDLENRRDNENHRAHSNTSLNQSISVSEMLQPYIVNDDNHDGNDTFPLDGNTGVAMDRSNPDSVESSRGGVIPDGESFLNMNNVDIIDYNAPAKIFGDMDINRLFYDQNLSSLQAEDIIKLHNFKEVVHKKIENFVKVIQKRRERILKEIDLGNKRLQGVDVENSAGAMAYLNKLQRIRISALKSETMELQNIRVQIVSIIDEYKKAMAEYTRLLEEGRNAANPTPYFQRWIESLNPDESSGLNKELNELQNYSRQMTSRNDLSRVNFHVNNQQKTLFPLRSLPSEILHLVLDKITSKADIVNYLRVCKLWALLIVKIIYYRPHINKKHQLELFMRTMRLKREDTVFDYRTMIKRLNFSFVGDYLHDEELYSFVGCQNLERLTLVFCKHITSAPVAAVLNGCKFLQSVDITGIKEISDNVFDTLAESCKRVQGFYVPQAKMVSYNSLSNFISNAPMLKRIKVTANNNMNDDLVELLAEKCPLLVEVDITLTANVHDSSLIKLFMKLTQLREFRITHNANVTDRFFLELSKNVNQLPSLRLLDLSGCENITDKTIERVVKLAPKLRNIFLGKCSRITDLSLVHLSILGKNLQTVHFGHCFNITDRGVRSLVKACPRIQYVDFACCTNLTNHTLYELSYLSRLKRIGLVKCSQMTDDGLLNMIALRGRNDTLERVHLSYCSNLTIYPIYELLMACPRLSHLSLTAVPSFLRPDITAFCRPAPSDFSDNQRQIFCVFSGKGVHKLRHYLMSLTTPTDGPQIDVGDTLEQYVISKHLLRPGEYLNDGIRRITSELNQDSAAILAATGLNQMNGMNSDFPFQNIDFERLDQVFNWIEMPFDNVKMSDVEIQDLLSQVDKDFCDDPFDEDYNTRDSVVAPGANTGLNSELCHIVKKFHRLDDQICDFEVNVSSLARVQFQFTGFLLHEMAQAYMNMVEINRQIWHIQKTNLESGVESDLKAIVIWRMLFVDKFAALLLKYQVSTVVLRLYLKDSITLLTRQRELFLAHQRTPWNPTIVEETPDSNYWQLVGDRIQLLPEQMRTIQFGLRNPQGPNRQQQNEGESQNEERSETPDDDVIIEDF
ncbi:SCF E3 ubiquitin ligase complex F-box protein GRR1 [Nakaseomyces bracarensis]|uniref:SCF E3 ubiquitin ligase complex F-box protein GRR1 n=1 Tax=Nakaseomyces bracarensis TaxID=273131 RepID=A0ABR4NQB1_9SACH